MACGRGMRSMGGVRGERCVLVLLGVLALAATRVEAQNCVNDLSGTTSQCTANDLSITTLMVLPGGVIDGCTSELDTATVNLQAQVTAAMPARYDIGIFVSLDGGNALTGSCFHDYLGPSLSPPG